MSSYWAGCSGTGLVLNQGEFDAFLAKYKEKNPSQVDNLKEYLEDTPLDEICFLTSAYAGEEIENLQVEAYETCPEKVTCFCELDDDSTQGLRLWPFRRSDGRMNVSRQKPDGSWEDEESYGLMGGWTMESEGSHYVIWSEKSFTSAAVFERPAYASYDEFMQEFKDAVGAYMPDDFDWNSHLGYISYACYA